MLNKFIYSINVYLKLIFFHLKNPFVFIGYLLQKPVKLDFKNGISLVTLQPLDAIIIYETIFDDSYKIRLLQKSNQSFDKAQDKPARLNRLNIIDVGAGLGDFSIFCAKKFTNAKITAFEPNPEQYKLLRENIRINNVKNVQTFNLAVGTKPHYDLFVAPSSVHSSTLKIPNADKRINVKGERLDGYIDSMVDLLKIDCEGAEVDILDSVSTAKFKKIKKVVAEYHNHIVKDEDKKMSLILKQNGFYSKKETNNLIPSTGYIIGFK